MDAATAHQSLGGERVPPFQLEHKEMIAMPNYTNMLKFERDFNKFESKVWMEENWTISFYYVGAYLLFIFLGQQYMQNRPRFELKKPLIVWNLALAAFSIFGAFRYGFEILSRHTRNVFARIISSAALTDQIMST